MDTRAESRLNNGGVDSERLLLPPLKERSHCGTGAKKEIGFEFRRDPEPKMTVLERANNKLLLISPFKRLIIYFKFAR
jgi:hypothetical protein